MRRAETDPPKVAPPSIPPLQGVRTVPVGMKPGVMQDGRAFFCKWGAEGREEVRNGRFMYDGRAGSLNMMSFLVGGCGGGAVS